MMDAEWVAQQPRNCLSTSMVKSLAFQKISLRVECTYAISLSVSIINN